MVVDFTSFPPFQIQDDPSVTAQVSHGRSMRKEPMRCSGEPKEMPYGTFPIRPLLKAPGWLRFIMSKSLV